MQRNRVDDHQEDLGRLHPAFCFMSGVFMGMQLGGVSPAQSYTNYFVIPGLAYIAWRRNMKEVTSTALGVAVGFVGASAYNTFSSTEQEVPMTTPGM